MSDSLLKGWFEKPTIVRHDFIKNLSKEQFMELLATSKQELGNPLGIFKDDPVGFITYVLGEHLWSKQVEICEAVQNHNKIAVPATNGCGKSFLMSRLVAWFVVTNPPTDTRVVSFAPSARQVRDILWNEIKALGNKHPFLPGRILTTEWKIDELVVANGFSCGGDADETKFQGIHKPNILIIVDEAAGVAPHVGKALRSISTNDDATIVAIGNPPTGDNQGFKWFEDICTDKKQGWEVIKISAWDLPSMTGEAVPPEVAGALTSRTWVEEIMRDFTPDEPWYKARLDAEFVDIGTSTAIPKEWVSRSIGSYDPARSGSIRIGVDVSGTGGDEYVVAVADGDNVQVVFRSSGLDNQDQTVLADSVFVIIKEFYTLLQTRISRGQLESQSLIVRIDSGGMGAPVADIFKKLIREADMEAKVKLEVIDFGQSTFESDKFSNIRTEMYWNVRELVRHERLCIIPDGKTTQKELVDQLSAPRIIESETDRRIALEKKKDMKRRKISSPDLADAIVLSVYDVTTKPAIINDLPSNTRSAMDGFVNVPKSVRSPRVRYY